VVSYSTVAKGLGDDARGVAVSGLAAATAAILLVCAPIISRALAPVGIDVFSRIFRQPPAGDHQRHAWRSARLSRP
jgi:hypothetical protein